MPYATAKVTQDLVAESEATQTLESRVAHDADKIETLMLAALQDRGAMSQTADRSASDRNAPCAARSHVTTGSPIGPLTLVAVAGYLTGLYPDAHRHGPGAAALGARGDGAASPFAAAACQLAAYFAGELTNFDVPLAPEGTPFQRQVWAALRDVPYGQTVTYGQLATRIGKPGASRAVGLANGRNPIFIMVPCHRVIGADGRLRGRGDGVGRKQFLLDIEHRHITA